MDYSEMCKWLDTVIDLNFDFNICAEQRSRDFVQMICNSLNKDEYQQFVDKLIIADDYFLVLEDFVVYYIINNSFPKLGIICDVLSDGRSLNLFLHEFFEKIRDILIGYNFDKDKVLQDFYDCIEICVFALYDAPILLGEEYKWRIYYHKFCLERDIRKFLVQLFEEDGFLNDLNTRGLLEEELYQLVDKNILDDTVSKDIVLSSVEQIIYEIAVKHEDMAKQLGGIYFRGGEVSTDVLSSTGTMFLKDFVDAILLRSGIKNVSKDFADIFVLCLIEMIKHGFVSLRYDCDNNVLVCVTELSLGIMPVKLGDCFDDFYRIVRFYFCDDDLVQQVEFCFGNLLEIPKNDVRYIVAVYMSKLMIQYRRVIGSMINWQFLFEK